MNIAIIGQGTAGIMSICHFLYYTDATVTNYYNPDRKTLGIGESTNSSFVNLLQKSFDFDLIHELEKVNGTIKLGTVYKGWREDTITNPLLDGSVAMHFDTNSFADFVIPRLKEQYGDRFIIEESEVNIDQIKKEYDWVISCTGFPKSYDEYNVVDLPVTSCVVNNIMEPGDWQYTGHKAARHGWIFEIPLLNRKSYGYLFNDTLNSKEEILKDFGIEKESAIYSFKPYYKKEILVDNVFYNGNEAMFYEPMAAMSLWMYENINRIAWDVMNGLANKEAADFMFHNYATDTMDIIKMFYHGGSNYNSPFWSLAQEVSKRGLSNNENFNKLCRGEIDDNGWVFNKWFLERTAKNFNYMI